MDLRERLKELVVKSGSNRKLGDLIGVSESTVRGWLNGNSEPKSKDLVCLANKFNISIDWLLTGYGVNLQDSNEFVKIPQVRGMDPTEPPQTYKIFVKSWIKWHIREDFEYDDLLIVRATMNKNQEVSKDTYVEIIQKGDIFLIDKKSTNWRSGGMYLIKPDMAPYTITDFSANRHYANGESLAFKVIGKCVWQARSY